MATNVGIAMPLLLLLLAVMIGSLLVPLAEAFLKGLAFAREPAHRVTPLDAWDFFDKGFRGHLWRRRWWILLGLLSLVAIAILVATVIVTVSRGSQAHNILVALIYPSLLAGFLGFVAAAMILWAPRCHSLGWLLASSFFSGILILTLCIVAFAFLQTVLPSFLMRYESVTYLKGARYSSVTVAIWPLYIGASSVVAALVYWRVARRRGERWLRLDG